jgi:hypothetical protein
LPVLSNPRAIPQLVDQRSGIEKRSSFFCGDARKGWTVAPANNLVRVAYRAAGATMRSTGPAATGPLQ